jgi:hypothetical protein
MNRKYFALQLRAHGLISRKAAERVEREMMSVNETDFLRDMATCMADHAKRRFDKVTAAGDYFEGSH